MKEIIKIEHLNFRYHEEYLFKDFNLKINQNEFISIIGPSGSGKTTLVKLLSGNLKYEGYATIGGYLIKDFYQKQIRSIIGITNNQYRLNFIGETVIDNLVYILENLEYRQNEIKKEVEAIISLFKLEDVKNKTYRELNNSERQKAIIASILINKPKAIILDECMHQLNVDDHEIVMHAIQKYHEDYHTTVILITNNLEDTLISDRIIVLDKGNILLDDTPEKVYARDKELSLIGLKVPFVIELSNNLKLYNLIDKTYYQEDELVDALWK